MTSGRLRYPGIFKDVCTALSSVGRGLVLDAQESRLVMYSVDAQLAFQLWATVSNDFMFQGGTFLQQTISPEEIAPIEIRSDNMVKALRNYGSIDEIELRIRSRRGTDKRAVTVTSEVRTYEGVVTARVQQRIPARKLDPDDLVYEPDFPGIFLWGEPSARQLAQMSRVCEQYRSLDLYIRVAISKLGEMTLTACSPEVESTTAWKVNLTEVLHDDNSAPDLVDDETPRTDSSDQHSQASCTVSARDWNTVLQCHQSMQRFIVGVAENGGVAIHGYLQHSSQEDCLSFYLLPATTSYS